MDTVGALVVVALVAAIILCGFGVWAVIELARTARSLRRSADETTARLLPLLEKSDVTVDAINAELLRIDSVITQFEQAGAKVSHASGTISEIVTTPAEIVSDVAGRVRRAWKDRKRAAEYAKASGDVSAAEPVSAEESPMPGPGTHRPTEG